jgi:hypothetical protein
LDANLGITAHRTHLRPKMTARKGAFFLPDLLIWRKNALVFVLAESFALSPPNGWYGIGIAAAALVVRMVSLAWTVHSSRADRRREILIRQLYDSRVDRIHALDNLVFYMFEVRISNESPSRPITVAGYRLSPPWRDDDLHLMPDPADGRGPHDQYVLSEPCWKYPRDSFLNHKLDDKGKLGPGDVIKGSLLFRGAAPIPDDLKHGEEVEVALTVYLQDGRSFSQKCLLRVDRGLEGYVQVPRGADLLVS